MKKIILFTFIAFLYSTAYAQIKVACIGNSITAGSGIKNRDKDSYPSVLNQMLGKDYLVRNFGISGRIIINKGDNPFMKEKTFCANCKVHCYKPEMREKIRKVMRFSGPRMLLYHPALAVWHLICSKKEAKK